MQFFKKHKIASLILLLLFFVFIVGATTWDGSWTTITDLWVGLSSDTPTNTLADNSAYVKGDIEVDGTIYADGGITDTTGGVTAGEIANVVRYYQLPLMSFTHNGSADITSSTAPGLEVDDLISNIVWADGETTPVQTTFRIPDDYASGGAFRVLATESDSTTPNQVDFDVYINTDGSAADSAATNQTPVALAGTTSTPDEITLSVATDFASLVAGNWVTLRMWRDNTATGTGDLEVKGVAFYYTATQ